MSEFSWKGYTWRVGQPWGITHLKKRNSWDGDQSVTVGTDDVLRLSVNYSPKEFGKVTKPYSVGLVSCCKDDFTYGTYTWKAKLPYGSNLWPALWMCARDSWPPEIDMMEGYTDNGRLDYIDNVLSTKIESNVHYSDDSGKHKNAGAKGIPTIMWKLFKKKNGINEYKLVWTKNYVKFYFNGILFKTVKDSEAINNLNVSPNHYPIMNLEITDEFSDIDYKYKPVFEIYDFKYEN